jgi:hypothetical protein
VFEYFQLLQTASFSSRRENQYEQNLPNLIADIKKIIPRLNELNSSEWVNMTEWIGKKAREEFT